MINYLVLFIALVLVAFCLALSIIRLVMYSFLGKPPGYDRVRNAEIGNKDFELDVLEEAYSSEHWIVRIFKVSLVLDIEFCN